MSSDIRGRGDHVDVMLSGYIDGELTQQDRQRVEVHCAECPECAGTLAELKDLRERVGKSRLSELGEDLWRENMNNSTVRAARGAGWLFFVGGLLLAGGWAIFAFLFDSSITLGLKLFTVAVYGGLGILFVSVLWQRLVERKTDKYKDVEI
jgi:hypothetical protein